MLPGWALALVKGKFRFTKKDRLAAGQECFAALVSNGAGVVRVPTAQPHQIDQHEVGALGQCGVAQRQPLMPETGRRTSFDRKRSFRPTLRSQPLDA